MADFCKKIWNSASSSSSSSSSSRFSLAAWKSSATNSHEIPDIARSQSESSRWEQWRRRSFSFASPSVRKPHAMSVDDVMTVTTTAKAQLWEDSDSDDEDNDETRPNSINTTRDRRSMSMDFEAGEPSHQRQLITRLWRKLPLQAKLYGGNGKVDLDLQKDRQSFSRSSAHKRMNGMHVTEHNPSFSENNVFGDKHIRFHHKIAYHPSQDEPFVALESYDDVLVRVCAFAAHDQRRVITKVDEFLERSLAFIRKTRTKHGNVVSLSNEEVRMWRRLARHDWAEEEITTTGRSSCLQQEDKERKLSSSSATAECTDDEEEEEDEEEEAPEEEEDLYVPDDVDLMALTQVVNSCVNFGDELFEVEDVEALVRVELVVDDDGWI